jgi:hypothetical protein
MSRRCLRSTFLRFSSGNLFSNKKLAAFMKEILQLELAEEMKQRNRKATFLRSGTQMFDSVCVLCPV